MANYSKGHKMLWIYWKIIGICPIGLKYDGSFDNSNRNSYYAILLILTFGILIVRKVMSRYWIVLPHETVISVMSGILCTVIEYAVIFSAWINIGLRQNLVRRIAKKFNRIRIIVNYHRAPLNLENQILRGIEFCVFLVNVTWLVAFVSFYYYIALTITDLKTPILANLPRVVTHNVVVMFVGAMKLVRARFITINAIAKRDFRRTRRTTSFDRDGTIIASEFSINSTLMDFTKYVEIHDELVNLINMLVDLLSIPIMLNLIVNYVQIAQATYMFYVIIYHRNSAFPDSTYIFVRWLFWLFVHLIEIIATIDACDSVTQEAKRSANILHRAFVSDSFEDYSQQIRTSLKLLQQPLQINIHGLEMNSGLLVTIFGSITTYMVIMMQLDQQVRDSWNHRN